MNHRFIRVIPSDDNSLLGRGLNVLRNQKKNCLNDVFIIFYYFLYFTLYITIRDNVNVCHVFHLSTLHIFHKFNCAYAYAYHQELYHKHTQVLCVFHLGSGRSSDCWSGLISLRCPITKCFSRMCVTSASVDVRLWQRATICPRTKLCDICLLNLKRHKTVTTITVRSRLYSYSFSFILVTELHDQFSLHLRHFFLLEQNERIKNYISYT